MHNPKILFVFAIGMIAVTCIVAAYTPIVQELPGIRNIRGAMVQDKPKYCNAYANYVQPDWDTTYTILQDFNPAVAQTICTCGQPYKIGGYKWKVDCVPT